MVEKGGGHGSTVGEEEGEGAISFGRELTR